jgi:F0F1-type ATP synthase membrane subunit c/vacuolar-type H+-ATPase subunit K
LVNFSAVEGQTIRKDRAQSRKSCAGRMVGLPAQASVIAPIHRGWAFAVEETMGRNVALTVVFFICLIGPAAVMAVMGKASIGALGRNPSAAPKILTAMIINLIFVEAIAVVALLVIWQLFTQKG